jgi:two-component system NtrC family sensor kinase
MKLARKLVFGLLTGIIVVLSFTAYLRVKREVELFERDTQRDNLLVGRAMAMSVRRAWQLEGESAAKALLPAFNAGSHVPVRWVSLVPDAPGPEAPRLGAQHLAVVRAGGELSYRSEALGQQLTYVPLVGPGGVKWGALELAESLQTERDYVRRAILSSALTTVSLIVVAGFLASVLGGTLVGRPVQELVGKVRRIATGDLAGPVSLLRRDELGELAVAINQMCDALGAANDATRRETAARLAAVEQLRHADRLTTVGKLASGIAHELGTPLNIVGGRGAMIAAGEATGDEVVENARIIVEQTERMTQIIRQLLDFARPRRVAKVRTDLQAMASEIATLLRPLADKRGVRIVVAEGRGVGQAVADSGQIQQVIMNLLVNAIQATDRGGTVTVGLREETLTLPHAHDADQPQPTVCLEVTDTGRGMDLETRARIFDPFFTTKDVGEGTGLGLSIAYGIVRDHGGWIDVHSQPGVGTTMAMHLPQDAAEQPVQVGSAT